MSALCDWASAHVDPLSFALVVSIAAATIYCGWLALALYVRGDQ